MNTRIKPHAKGILIEFSEIEKTESGVYLPNGTQKTDINKYEGDIVLAVGEGVTTTKVGDQVMFYPHATPTSFELMDNDGLVHKYMLFREVDIACLVEPLNLEQAIQPPVYL